MSGSLLLAFVVPLTPPGEAGWRMRSLLAVGFCGGFTTFSGWSYGALALLQARAYGVAAACVPGSVALGLTALAAGLRIAERP